MDRETYDLIKGQERRERERMKERHANETDPVMREAYALAERAGFDWYDTESGARRMAEHAAEEILQLRMQLEQAKAGELT